MGWQGYPRGTGLEPEGYYIVVAVGKIWVGEEGRVRGESYGGQVN